MGETSPAPSPPVPPPEALAAMPDASGGPGVTDPSGLGAAAGRLTGGSRSQGHAAFMVLACSLDDGESVESVAQCRYLGAPGALALTDRRLLVVNAREWEPDVTTVQLEPGLSVKGWQDLRKNHLSQDGDDVVIDGGDGDMLILVDTHVDGLVRHFFEF